MASYTHGHHESVLRSHRWRTAENSVAYLLPHLRADQTLLDVGAGPGTITADVAERVARVTALEMSEDALALARATFAERGIDADVVVGDVQDLPLADDTFDVVHAHQVLHHVADPVAALREMGRVAAAGGLVAARETDFHGLTWYPDVPELAEWLALFQAIARANGAEPDAGRRLLAWAHAAGFDDVTPSASVWCFATPDERAWWGGQWADRVTRSAFADQARAAGLADRADLDRIAAGWRAWAADPDGWIAVLHGEVLIRV